MACRTRTNYRRYRIRTVEGQDDFASMAEVVRRRYSRVLLEAREVNPDAAEFSQENPSLEAVAIGILSEAKDLTNQTRDRQIMDHPTAREVPRSARDDTQQRCVRLPDLIIVDGGKGQFLPPVVNCSVLGLHDLPIIGLAKEFEEIYRPGRALPLQLPPDSGALRLLQRIRDEAHRFANTYHQLLMKKRIGESILDDCPGVSQNRKNLLLRRFRFGEAIAESKCGRDRCHRRHRTKVGRRSPSISAKTLKSCSF